MLQFFNAVPSRKLGDAEIVSLRSHVSKARHFLTRNLYRLGKHGEGPDPDVAVTIEWAIDCHEFFSFAVAGNMQKFIVIAFIVSILPCRGMLLV